MRNINELIGIIKGISFDGIVNAKEVMRLQTWINKNRNLAYDKKQIELINLIDDVLEDQVIDDDERELLVSKAEEYAKEIGDNTAKIYELNGIIEGIVCDGEVNEAEVFRLKEWMDDYGSNIRNHKPSMELCKVIDDILEDGIVTEEEQNYLLEILSKRIKDAQFETKLEYLCKQVRERKNIGADLIDLLDNESAMEEIHKRAEKELFEALSSYSMFCSNQEIIVISLVLIAMLDYDGNYYDGVRNTYKNLYSKNSEQRVEGLIRTILSRYRTHNYSVGRDRIINVALENAIVPRCFLPAFFDFIYDIYKLNFDYSMPKEPYDEFEFVFEGLRNNLLSEGDDISLNVTQKTYKLIASTKRLITLDGGLDALIKLSIIIVNLIDKRYWNKEIKIFNPYLKAGYDKWEKQIVDTPNRSLMGGKEKNELRSRWEPKFVFDNGSIFLLPPIHRVKAQYDYKTISIVVKNEKNELYFNDRCDIREIIGGYQISVPKICLDRPLGKIKYLLMSGDEIIYESKNKLFRDYMIFNEAGQELNNNTNYEGMIYICYRDGMLDIKNMNNTKYYSLGYMKIRVGDALEIGNDVFNFSQLIKPGVFGKLQNNCWVYSFANKNSYKVYKKVDFVVFETSDTKSKYEIIVNDTIMKLADMSYKTEIRDNVTKYIIDLGIEESGFYKISVNQIIDGKRKNILNDMFVCDDIFDFNTDKISDEMFRLELVSGLLLSKMELEIDVNGYNIDCIQFDYKNKKYSYRIPLDFGLYSIEGNRWNSLSNDIWIGDVSADTTLQLLDSECDGVLIYDEKGVKLEDNILVEDKGIYKEINIGFLNSYKQSCKYVMMVFTVYGKKKHVLFCYNKCVLMENETEIINIDNPRKILVTPIFKGNNSVFFEIYEGDKKIFTSKPLQSGQTEEIDGFKSFQDYNFCFYEKPHGLVLNRELLTEINKRFYSKKDFEGKMFKIENVFVDQYVEGKMMERVDQLNRAFIKILKEKEDNIFEGKIVIKADRIKELRNINPVEMELCSEIIDDRMYVYITNNGDGLLYNLKTHLIINTLNDLSAPDIYLYKVNVRGEM